MSDFIISRFDADIKNLKILEQYSIGRVKIYITKDGRYLVQEPPLSHQAEITLKKLMASIHDSFPLEKTNHDEIIPVLQNALEEESRKSDNFEIWKKEKENIEYYLTRDIANYSEIDILINDKYIEDILSVKWDNPITIVHKKFHQFTLLETNIVFKSEELMSKLIHRISQRYGDPPNDLNPTTSFTNKENIRFTFTDTRSITPDGPTMSIRKPSVDAITIYHLLKGNMLSLLSAVYLWIMIDLKGFGLIIGSPSSGKTTLINAALTMSNPRWHYFTIEDALELKLRHSQVSRHQTKMNSSIHGGDTGKNTYDVFALCRLSLRFRPDFVIVGEVLGKEAEGLFQVASSGSGCISSFHASNARHTLTRLEAPPINISKTQTSLISYILHISWITRQKLRHRRILSITEPIPVEEDGKLKKDLKKVFEYNEKTDKLEPESVDELIKGSEKLKQAKVILGISDMKTDLKNRMNILEKILNDNISDPKLISKEIFKYYQLS